MEWHFDRSIWKQCEHYTWITKKTRKDHHCCRATENTQNQLLLFCREWRLLNIVNDLDTRKSLTDRWRCVCMFFPVNTSNPVDNPWSRPIVCLCVRASARRVFKCKMYDYLPDCGASFTAHLLAPTRHTPHASRAVILRSWCRYNWYCYCIHSAEQSAEGAYSEL